MPLSGDVAVGAVCDAVLEGIPDGVQGPAGDAGQPEDQHPPHRGHHSLTHSAHMACCGRALGCPLGWRLPVSGISIASCRPHGGHIWRVAFKTPRPLCPFEVSMAKKFRTILAVLTLFYIWDKSPACRVKIKSRIYLRPGFSLN